MLRYKLLDINNLKVLDVTDNVTFKYVYVNQEGFIISSIKKVDNAFGIVTGNGVYNVFGFKGEPILEYPTVYMEMISINEYNTLKPYIDKKEYIVPEEIQREINVNLEFIKEVKIEELSKASNVAIEAGIDVLINYNIEHFDLSITDQLNLQSIQLLILRGVTSFTYHAKNLPSRTYLAEDMQLIIDEANTHINKHNVYFNQLKQLVLNCTDIESVKQINYSIDEVNKTDFTESDE